MAYATCISIEGVIPPISETLLLLGEGEKTARCLLSVGKIADSEVGGGAEPPIMGGSARAL